jgi:hypothetical protein
MLVGIAWPMDLSIWVAIDIRKVVLRLLDALLTLSL